MKYIYCYENKLNGHKYIGQTNNLKNRYSAHKSQSYNQNSKDYNCLFHKKIRQYGLENFEFYVLEEINEEYGDEYVDYREQFWIEKLNSWCRYGQGYNEITGGKQFKKNITVSDEQIKEIKFLLETTDLPLQEIAKNFNTYRECISRINNGRYAYEENRNYPIRVTRNWKQIPQEIKEEIALLLRDSKMSFEDMAKKYQISEHSISNINSGLSNLQGEFTYPIRKANQKITQQQEEQIYNLLKQGVKIIDIARQVGVSRDTVSRRKKKYNF